jgi:lipid A 3-O-deacylase
MRLRNVLLVVFSLPLFSMESICEDDSFPAQRQNIEDPHLLSFGVGIFNVVRGNKIPLFQLEYRSDYSLYRSSRIFIRPLVGIMATTEKSIYVYGGIAFDFFFPNHIVFTPSFAPGFYHKGDGKDLGLPLEFRSSLELSYRFEDASRVGAMFYHMSNASLGHKNPGTECLVFFYSFPFKFSK